MSSCPNCRNRMEYVDQYDKWYCHNCQSYQNPAAPPPPPPPPPGAVLPPPPRPPNKQKSLLLLASGIVVVIIIIISAAFVLVILPGNDNDSSSGGVTVKRLRDDVVIGSNFETNFKSYNDGDSITIRDEILYMVNTYDWDENEVTYMWFESAHKEETEEDWVEYDPDFDEYDYIDYDFDFEGDLTDDYDVGDTVEISLHVISVADYGETFSEIWGGDDFKDCFPDSCIKLLKRGTVLDPDGDSDVDENPLMFPTIELSLKDGSWENDDSLRVKHVAGDPLDWSKYKIIITNNSDPTQVSTMTTLVGFITAGVTSVFNESNTPAFSDIDYQKTRTYEIEVYAIKENKRVFDRKTLICE